MMKGEPSVIHVVDDDASFRKSMARLLRASGYEVSVFESAEEFLEKLPAAASGCILLDVKMPRLGGPGLQRRLNEQGVTLPIIFLTGHGDIQTSVQAIKAGADDFLPKPVQKKTLLDAIERALEHQRSACERQRQFDELRLRVETLTPREREVFGLVVQGRLNKQIGHALGMSVRTVKAHRHNLMHKLQVQSIAALVSLANRLALQTVQGVAEPAPPATAQGKPHP